MDSDIKSRSYEISNTSDSNNVSSDKPKVNIVSYLKNKKILIPLVLLLILGLILVILPKESKSTDDEILSSDSMCEIYVSRLESKLKGILSSIKGAGNVNVMIYVESGPEKVVATDEVDDTVTTNKGGDVQVNATSQKKPVVKNGDLYVLYEKMPEIKGVIVVASGARDMNVKLKLITAVQAVLNVTNNQIQIFEGI